MKDKYPEYVHVRNIEFESLVHLTSQEYLNTHLIISQDFPTIKSEPEENQLTISVTPNGPQQGK